MIDSVAMLISGRHLPIIQSALAFVPQRFCGRELVGIKIPDNL
jgi:hypothetical protein